MSIVKRHLGKLEDGREITLFALSNLKGMTVEITNYGGTVISIMAPDRKGNYADVVLGCDTLDGLLRQKAHFGSIIGRHANRIEGSAFELNGVTYFVAANNGRNHLHGGNEGFDKKVWNAEAISTDAGESLQLTYLSGDGEENYPGNLEVKVIYTLTEDNALEIDYHAVSDRDTVVNLTNHAYFNLAGHASGSVLGHELMIDADFYTPNNSECIPTGEIRSVKGTPMDFTSMKPVGRDIECDCEQIRNGSGYDHNWVLKVSGKKPEKAAEVYEPESGRVMEVYTTKPGVQLYTGNFIGNADFYKDGAAYTKRNGLCLETQYYPNAMKYKHFPSPVLKAGAKYRHTTVYKFSVK